MGALGTALLACGLSACATGSPEAHAQRIAAAARMAPQTLSAGPFVLQSFARLGTPGGPIDLYIEGDGRAWRSRSEPAADPTPHMAMALLLAATDPAANVVYLARPCQFTLSEKPCERAYWTNRRYSPEVVAALDEAVGHYAAGAGAVNLIGYSGGGTLAVLIAARRSDVASIRTVAGNLDTDEFVRLHRLSPMPASINPIDEAPRVAGIAQIHFSGSSDKVVPAAIAERFAQAAGGACTETRVIAAMAHASRWDLIWPWLLAQRPQCRGTGG